MNDAAVRLKINYHLGIGAALHCLDEINPLLARQIRADVLFDLKMIEAEAEHRIETDEIKAHQLETGSLNVK